MVHNSTDLPRRGRSEKDRLKKSHQRSASEQATLKHRGIQKRGKQACCKGSAVETFAMEVEDELGPCMAPKRDARQRHNPKMMDQRDGWQRQGEGPPRQHPTQQIRLNLKWSIRDNA